MIIEKETKATFEEALKFLKECFDRIVYPLSSTELLI